MTAAPEPHATATPAPVVTPPVASVIPTLHHHAHAKFVEYATLFGADVVTGIITALFGLQIGRQVNKLFQGVKAAVTNSPQPMAATGNPAVTPAGNVTTTDPTIHPLPFGIGPRDEAEAGMTLGATVRTAHKRVEGADASEIRLEKRKLKQLYLVLGFIANKLNQSERDFLRQAVAHIETAELQAQFWQDLVLASNNAAGFTNFMKSMGIVRDTPELMSEFSKAAIRGLDRAISGSASRTAKERRAIERKTRALLRRP